MSLIDRTIKNPGLRDVNFGISATKRHGTEISQTVFLARGFSWMHSYLEKMCVQRSEATLETYRRILNAWLSFIGGEQECLNATTETAWRFVHFLKQKSGIKTRLDLSGKISQRTVNKYVTVLRSFYKFLIEEMEVCKHNPFMAKGLKAKERHIPRKRPTEAINFEDVTKLLNAPDVSTVNGLRDSAIMHIMFGTGCRRAEALNLTLQDIRQSEIGTWYAHFRKTKSDADKQIAIHPSHMSVLFAYSNQRLREGAEPPSPFFVAYSKAGKPSKHKLSDSGWYSLFKYYCKRVGLPPYISPHSTRATGITKLARDGVSIAEIQNFSGHKSIAMVELYIQRDLSVDKNPGLRLKWG